VLDYEVDGAVVKVDPLPLHAELGIVGGREPRWAVAYKYAPTWPRRGSSPSASTWGARGS
jgi:NAD-dependent DNA ligase